MGSRADLVDRTPAFRVAVVVVVVVKAAVLGASLVRWTPASGLVPFRSYAEIAWFLDQPRSPTGFSRGGGLLEGGVFAGPGSGLPGFSPTNVQVDGIDEPDIVKTDGTHLYVAADSGPYGGASEVLVAKAVPASELSVVARISLEDDMGFVQGLFVDGSRLAVIASGGTMASDAYAPGSARTSLLVYDLPIGETPVPFGSFDVSGSYVSARLASPYVYTITNEYVSKVDGTYRFPSACAAEACGSLAPSSVYYDPSSREAGAFTNLLAVDLSSGESQAVSVVTGSTSVAYMSHAALYLAFFKWEPALVLPSDRPLAAQERTTIHRIRIAGLGLQVAGSGDVPGRVLNQFSLDEHRGYLRVATTTWSGGDTFRSNSHLYVLDESLAIAGRLEGLAPGESVYASRFLGDRAFLVTFEKIDPFFVIDLSVPLLPRVLGSLKVPGYSDYLHPLGEDRVIGLGKDAIPDAGGSFAWYQGLKLSLFDVADPADPEEASRVLIGDRGTESEALRDHHAFLFAPDRSLLVIPVDLAVLDENRSDGSAWTYGEYVWQGAYAFSVDPHDGFRLEARITHRDAGPFDPWGDRTLSVRRGLLVGDVLYTVSAGMIKANALFDFEEIGSLLLP